MSLFHLKDGQSISVNINFLKRYLRLMSSVLNFIIKRLFLSLLTKLFYLIFKKYVQIT